MNQQGKVVEYVCLGCGTQGTQICGDSSGSGGSEIYCPKCGRRLLAFQQRTAFRRLEVSY